MSRHKIPGKWDANTDSTRSYVLTYTNAKSAPFARCVWPCVIARTHPPRS